MRLVVPYDLERLGENADMAVNTANEEILGSRTHAAQFVTLAKSALEQTLLVEVQTDIEDRGAFSVGWQFDFGNVEEIEDFPLQTAH